MDKQHFAREKLNERFKEIKKRNNLFSSRSFARLLGISISTYSEFMSGKRTLSSELLIRLIDIDSLTPEEQNLFFILPLKIDKILNQAGDIDQAQKFLTETHHCSQKFRHACELLDKDNKLLLSVNQKTLEFISETIEMTLSRILKAVDAQNRDDPKSVVVLEIKKDYLDGTRNQTKPIISNGWPTI